MKSLEQLCVLRQSVFDPSKRDTVLSLTHLAADKIDGPGFLEENHVTDGMRTLLLEAFRRLQGKSEQAVFKLTQAMGGGKTLCANMSETLPPSEFRVEGGEGMRDEYPA